jgi:hypothetical protein
VTSRDGGRNPGAAVALHFVGIGGAGMSGLALVAHALGAAVTGSDRALARPTPRRCARPASRRPPATTPRTCPDGAELVRLQRDPAARTRSGVRRASAAQRELHRAELLGELTRLRPTIAVTGTHGKTTTSSMLVHALRAAALDPAYLVGGEVRSTGTNAAWGAGEWLVVEADESDRSLLELHAGDRGAHERRARPPHDVRLPARRRRGRSRPSSQRDGRKRVGDSGTWPPVAGRFASAFHQVVHRLRRRVVQTQGGSRFVLDGRPVELTSPRAHRLAT